jgi:DNA-binding NtrC family response regulator
MTRGAVLGDKRPSELRHHGREAGAERKILIVDDEQDLVTSCVRLLGRRGYKCFVAHTGKEAIALIDEDAPDVVLTDFNLPDLDGLRVLSDAGRRKPPIPGILMSADTSSGTVRRACDSGAISYLAKPFTASTLIEAVGTVLEARSSRPGTE